MVALFSVNLYKEYTSLKSRELEELPRFVVMIWQPFMLLRGNSYLCKCSKKITGQKEYEDIFFFQL